MIPVFIQNDLTLSIPDLPPVSKIPDCNTGARQAHPPTIPAGAQIGSLTEINAFPADPETGCR
jgi:hypothetical protein